MTRLHRLICAGALLCAAALHAPAGEPETDERRVGEALAAKQEMVRDQIRRLVDRMYRLSEALEESEPASADKLLAALTQAKERLVELQADEALALLKRHDLVRAGTVQQKLLDDLNEVLEVMLAGPDEGERLAGEIERLEAFRKELDKLIDKQQGHVDGTRATLGGEARAAAIARAVENARALLEAQQSLSRRTGESSRDEAAKLAAEQQALAGQAADAARQVGQIGAASEAGPGEPEQNAQQSLESAGEQMAGAAKQLSKGDTRAAGEHQQAAEEALKRALHELQKEQKRLDEQRDLKQRADAQRATQQQTDRLARRMRGEQGGGGQGGGQQGGQQPGGQGSQQGGQRGGEPAAGEPAPGANRVEQAQREMGRGADDLEQRDVPEALREQQDALDELEQADRELAETLEQLRRQEQLDTLANVEERLRAILNRQKGINERTGDLEAKPPESWERADELALAELVGRQRTNVEETNQTLYILKEDATTVAFPQVVEQVLDDMRLVADRLAKRHLGAPTQQVQADIVETLEELLAAVERKQQELREGQGQGAAGSAGNPPLLPSSAELKLLKQSQLRVNRRTVLLKELEAGRTAADPELAEQVGKLSERQKKLAELAREMHSKMTGE